MTIDVAEEPMTGPCGVRAPAAGLRVDHVLDVTARADGGFALSDTKA